MDLGTMSRWRCAAVWAGLTLVAVALLTGLEPVLEEAATAFGWGGLGGLGGVGFEQLLVYGCAAVAAATTSWLWLVATLVTFDAARGLFTVRRGVPEGLGRALLALCGTALASGLASGLVAPASAASGTGLGGPDTRPLELAGLRLPERASVTPAPPGGGQRPIPRATTPVRSAAPASAARAHPDAMVVVAAGDTLWDIAAEQLGPLASQAETAAGWPVVYALNRDLIGPDPGLIEPGQRLHLPPVEADGATR